jgi:hypothetical protein
VVFENRNLSPIFEPKKDENGEGTRVHNEERHVVKTRNLRWKGYLVEIGEVR